jgi:hypothetical protein
MFKRMKIKKLFALAAAVIIALTLSACGDDEELVLDDTYDGVLSKVRIGMTLKQVRALQRLEVSLYYESDTVIWAVDGDIDLVKQLTALLPEQQDEQMYYYVDDSKAIVTYYFKKASGSSDADDMRLTGYSQGVSTLLDRELGNAYFKAKSAELQTKHNPDAVASTTKVGVEDIDLELVTTMSLSCPSYDLTFNMTETYDTVNDVSGYYVTRYEIQIMEKAVKDSTPVDGSEASS